MKLLRRWCVIVGFAMAANAADKAVPANEKIWIDPTDIATRNLIYGQGGKKDAPLPNASYTFEKEDLDGTNPKFVVRDQEGTKWKVKLGVEAQPEIAATRLVWAAGYTTDEDYFLPKIYVDRMPDHLKRGESMVRADGSFANVRLERHLKHDDKAGPWKWDENPFTGTKELDGLRVLMSLINNWDLKDVNNAVLTTDEGKIYMVKDLGASFGTTGESWTLSRSKGNIKQFEKSKFITSSTPAFVNFGAPSRPALIFLFNPVEFFRRVHMEHLGDRIPRDDVKWVAGILSKLSDQQIHDAFLAAGYSPAQANEFAAVIARRIAALKEL